MYIWNRIVRAENIYLLTHWELTRSSWSYLSPHEATRWFRETQKKSNSWNDYFWMWGGDGFEHGWPRRLQPTWYCKVQIELAQTRRHPVDPPNIPWIHLTSCGSTYFKWWIFDFETTLFNLNSLNFAAILAPRTFSLLYCHYPYVAYRNGGFCVTSIVGLTFFSTLPRPRPWRRNEINMQKRPNVIRIGGKFSPEISWCYTRVRECRFVLCIHLDTSTFKGVPNGS